MVTLAKRIELMGMVEGERGEDAVKIERDLLRVGSEKEGKEVGLGLEGWGGEWEGSNVV